MKHVLVVENEDNERFTLTRVLERAGFSVTALPDGSEVLHHLEQTVFDAVLLDVMMPGTDGLSLARLVAERHPDMPIVLTSAFHFFPAQLSRLGINHLYFLDKPLDVARLFALLETEGHKPH